MNTKRALVTGSNRSGSTWVGKVLAANSKVDTIIEPFNLNRIQRYGMVRYDHWYPKITGPETQGHDELHRLLKYYLEFGYDTFFKQLFQHYEGHDYFTSLRKKLRRAGKPVKVLKDPTALFSVPWIVKEFGVRPVILIRHPAAYALSIKDKNWWFDFSNLLDQSSFFTGALEGLYDEVRSFKENEKEKNIIENAALLWKVFYMQVDWYREQYPDWFYITHEALSVHPLEQFNKMFEYLNIELNTDVEKYIHETTHAKEKGKHQRNSKENMNKWKNNLSTFEKDTVYGITREVSDRFYESF